MVSWTCRRALLNWQTLCSGDVFRLPDATAISQQARAAEGLLGKMPSRSILEGAAVARCSHGAFPGGNPRQVLRSMHPKSGLGREKRPLPGKIRAPCIRKRAPFGKICVPCIRKALQTVVWEYTARRSCHEGAAFAARTPRIMHGAQILPFLGAPFERFDLFRVGWGGAHGSRTALALYGAVLVFRALSPFVRSGTAVLRVRHTQLRAAPRSHAGCSCCRARLRVRRACYPPV